MSEIMRGNTIEDNQDGQTDRPRIKLPSIEFGADESEIIKTLAATIEQVPLDEQESYWQIMDDSEMSAGEKVNLINDLIRKYNGDIQE